MSKPVENSHDERALRSNRQNMGSDITDKKVSRLAETMQLIREKEGVRRINAMNAHGESYHQLSLLLGDLEDVIAELGDDRRHFDFYLSNNKSPQLLIDKTTFVVMAQGEEGFRLLKETRAGRILLNESYDRAVMGESVVHYVAERLSHIENDRIEGQRAALAQGDGHDMRENTMMEREPQIIVKRSRLRSFMWFLIGTITGAVAVLALAWFRDEITTFLAAL